MSLSVIKWKGVKCKTKIKFSLLTNRKPIILILLPFVVNYHFLSRLIIIRNLPLAAYRQYLFYVGHVAKLV